MIIKHAILNMISNIITYTANINARSPNVIFTFVFVFSLLLTEIHSSLIIPHYLPLPTTAREF